MRACVYIYIYYEYDEFVTRMRLLKKGLESKVVDSHISKARTESRESLLCQVTINRKSSRIDRMPLVIDFHWLGLFCVPWRA